ncbi:TetR/AcrR family transcriptional regulator [Kineococcus terrestris]|uniref:TetR/AcrR family transcriptional regulator n=1 Tax=Kineococcus terrestris TaxID=2044856 RepID=UPI0034DB1B91
MSPSAAAEARARAREDVVRRIVGAGRRQLAEVGAAGLSLRAVARELGMVSSAVYRYVATRDELLTHLIVEAYDALGEAAERADAACASGDAAGRWRAVCRATRAWALAHPHEFALVHGSPVPGYAAPAETVRPAGRAPAVMGRLLREAVAAGVVDPAAVRPLPAATPAALRADLRALAAQPVFGLLPAGAGPVEGEDALVALAAHGLAAWQQVTGAVVLELDGALTNVVGDRAAWFDVLVDGWLDVLLPGTGNPRPGVAENPA